MNQNGKSSIPIKSGNIRYTVPQYIECDGEVSVYYRVGRVFRDVRVVVKDGDRVVFSAKKIKLLPAEMETVKLSSETLASLSGSVLEFTIEE